MSIKYYEVSVNEVAGKLKMLLCGIPEVKIAVLFGSATRRSYVRDVDVGVYLDSEWGLKDLIKTANMFEDALGLPVDVVPLREAKPKLRLKALLNGVRLVVRDEKLFTQLLKEAMSEAVDVDLKLMGDGSC